MDENKLENIESIKNIILDERKLVTYTSISKELSIHVNRAKILLQEFINDLKRSKPNVDLTITYLLSGTSENNEIFTTVVLEEELNIMKEKVKTVFFEHIYSVCYGRSVIDKVAFATVNSFEDYLICNGRVKSDVCVKRTFEELGTLKTKSQTVPEKTSKAESKNLINEVTHKVKNEGQHKTLSNPEIHPKPEAKSEITSPQKNSIVANGKSKPAGKNTTGKGIMGFFSKTNVPSKKADVIKQEKMDNQNDNVIKKSKINEEESNIKKENVKDLNNIEMKQEKSDMEKGNKSLSPKATELQSTAKKTQSINSKQNKVIVKKEIKLETSSEIESPVKTKPTNKKQEKKSKKTDEKKKTDKKRKRVLQVSDSESDNEKNDPFSDEMQVDHESEDEIPPTPSTNIVKITSGLVNPKKRRKIVDKTYTDEEGFILTKKEEIYESCSDEEVSTKENVDNKKQNHVEVTSTKEVKIKNTKKKVSPPQKGKQPTMMSFFKKVPN